MSPPTEASQDFHNGWTAEAITVLTCLTLSLYNCIELVLIILTTFQTWHGLYFTSLIVATVGIIPYCLGFLLEYFGILVFWASILFSTIGWVMLITGQSFVLYSRLGLSLQNDRAFLTRGDVFSDDQIDSYIELKWEEVMRWETTPSPVEFDMYYSS